jgi:pimeloyl-[acyl-carrier protein] methyl ester esterase
MSASSPLALLLLPGIHGTPDLFAPFIGALRSPLPRVVAAAGVTYPPSEPLSYGALTAVAADAAAALTAATPPGTRLLILGESFSGPIALALAAQLAAESASAAARKWPSQEASVHATAPPPPPPRVAGVILAASFVLPPVALLAATPLWGVRAVARAAFGAGRLWVPDSGLRWALAGAAPPPGLLRDLRRVLRGADPAVMAARVAALARVDARGAARAAGAPILYLSGARDVLVGRRAVAAVRAACPDVVVRTLDAPHCVLQVAPREAAAAVVAFLDAQPEVK